MGIKIITGRNNEPHITPLQDSMWHRALQSRQTGVFDFGRSLKVEKVNNTKVQVFDGIGSIQGRFFCIEPEESEYVEVESGSIGYHRKDMLVIKHETDTIEQTQKVYIDIISGESKNINELVDPPVVTEESIDLGVLVVQTPLAIISIENTDITSIEMQIKELSDISGLTKSEFSNLVERIGIELDDSYTKMYSIFNYLAPYKDFIIEQKKLIWTNPNPNLSFSNNRLSTEDLPNGIRLTNEIVDLEIHFRNKADDPYEIYIQRFHNNGKLYIPTGSTYPSDLYLRSFKLSYSSQSGNMIEWDHAYYQTFSGRSGSDDKRLIPIKVYAIMKVSKE